MGMAIPGTTDEAPLVPPPIEQRAPGCPRVLLVENRPDWQVIVARVLDSAGYFWRLAPTAQAALRELEQESFHLVILDLKLQENDLPLTSSEGWLLLDYLVGSRPATSIVIVSGEARPADVADLLMHYPVVGFIEKQQFTPQAIIDAVAQATRAPAMHLQMFGTFRVWRDDQAIVIWERPQAETVVKMLLARRIQGGRVVAADELMTRLWPDTDEENGRKKLLPLISNARRTLEPGIEPRDSHFIVRSSGGYFFDLGGSVVCDVLTFREHLRAGRQLADEMRPEAAIAELEKARTLYQGDFLEEDYYVDWAIDLRRDIVGELCDGLIVLSDCYATLRQYEAAIDACELVVRKDPLQELVYRRLMCLHFCNGDKARALKVHRDCITLFEELFGERPSPITHALYEAIARDDASACDMAHWASG
jgi:DNA-binding SARP family transcriptional activator